MADVNIPRHEPGLAAGSHDAYTPPGVIYTGPGPTVVHTETLADQGADLPAYSVVGKITVSGKLTLCDPSVSDGSEDPVGITLAEAPDVNGDQKVPYAVDGHFNPAALNYDQSTGGFASVAALQEALRLKCPHMVLRAPATASLSAGA